MLRSLAEPAAGSWSHGPAARPACSPADGATIPGMNILKSLAVKDVLEATRAIPVIDFSPAFRATPADPEGLETVAREVRRASETVGFFYLAGHGVPDAEVDGRRVEAAPVPCDPARNEEQAASATENNIGYLAVRKSIEGASTGDNATCPNYNNESFFISHDRGADHPDVLAVRPSAAP